MQRSSRLALFLLAALPLAAPPCTAQSITQVTVERDEHGFPHIDAPSEEAAYYALGYMQALDLRAELLLKIALTSGRANKSFPNAIQSLSFPGSAPRAHRFGPDHLPLPDGPTLQIPTLLDIDKSVRLYRYIHNANLIWLFLPQQDRLNLTHFAQGINDAFAENAQTWIARGDFRYPQLAALGLFNFQVEPKDVIQNTLDFFTVFRMADNQQRINEFYGAEAAVAASAPFGSAPAPSGWPTPGGAENPLPTKDTSSNQWAFRQMVNGSPKVSHIIDPHLPLFDIRFLLYSFQLRHPGGMVAGATAPGFPVMLTGTTDHVAWSHTAHGDATLSNWIVQIDPSDPGKYQTYRTHGCFAPLYERTYQIENQSGGFDEFKTFGTTHGRLLARDTTSNLGLTYRLARRGRFNVIRQYYAMSRACNIYQGIFAMAQQGLPTFNTIMTDDENIFFVYNELLAKRNESIDWTAPVDAMDRNADWGRLHFFFELPQVFNPPDGYLINSNVSPTLVTPNPGYELDDFPNYMVEYQQDPVLTYRHQSAQRAVNETFNPTVELTRADLFTMATDARSFYYPELVEKLAATRAAYTGNHPPFPALSAVELSFIDQEIASWLNFIQVDDANTDKANTVQPRMEIYRFLLRLNPEFDGGTELQDLADGEGNFDSAENTALTGIESYTALRTVLDTIQTAAAFGFTPQTTWGQTHVLDNFVARFPVNGGGFSVRATDPARFDGQFVMDAGQAWVQTVEHNQQGSGVKSFFQKPVWGPLDPLVPWINTNSLNFSNDLFRDFYVEPGALGNATIVETRVLDVPNISCW